MWLAVLASDIQDDGRAAASGGLDRGAARTPAASATPSALSQPPLGPHEWGSGRRGRDVAGARVRRRERAQAAGVLGLREPDGPLGVRALLRPLRAYRGQQPLGLAALPWPRPASLIAELLLPLRAYRVASSPSAWPPCRGRGPSVIAELLLRTAGTRRTTS